MREQKSMKKYIRLILFMMSMIVVLTACGTSDKKKDSDKSSEAVSSENSKTDKQNIKEPSDENGQDDKDLIGKALKSAGIEEYSKIDLKPYEKKAGIQLSNKYLSYHFFYNSDGCRVEAFISAPVELLNMETKAPCLIFNHGGNRDYGALQASDLTTCFYAYQFDAVCVATNYRGCGDSEGDDEFGGKDVDDVINLIDICEKISFVDKKQINMLGISRGGLMTYETLRKDDRINRAVVVSGISDSFMEYKERDDMKTVYRELVGGTSKEMTEEYEKRSPVYWADELKAPVMLIHTENDDKVSVSQADKMAKCLKKADREYEYIKYKADTHGEIRDEDVMKIKGWFLNK